MARTVAIAFGKSMPPHLVFRGTGVHMQVNFCACTPKGWVRSGYPMEECGTPGTLQNWGNGNSLTCCVEPFFVLFGHSDNGSRYTRGYSCARSFLIEVTIEDEGCSFGQWADTWMSRWVFLEILD